MFRIRYKVASFLLVIGLAIAFSTVVNIVVIQHFFDKQTAGYMADDTSGGTKLSLSITLDALGEGYTEPETEYYYWKSFFDGYELNGISSDFYLVTSGYLDDMDTTVSLGVLLYQCEGIESDIIDSYEVSDETNQVYVSEDFAEYIYEEDGYQFISIGGKAYSVAGLLDEDAAFSIVFYYDDLSEQFMESYFAINDISVTEVCYDSVSMLETFASECEDEGYIGLEWQYTGDEDSDDKLERAQTQSSSQKSIYIILAVFSILDCGVVIEFWMMGRRRNLAILKAFGYSYGRIYRLLYTDFIKLAIPSLPIGVLIAWASFSVLSSTGTDMEFTFALSDILVYVLALALLALILTVIAVQHVPRRTDILDVIKED